jgi:hypothetical protein
VISHDVECENKMKTLLLILFFGKTVLLTSAPVDLTEKWIELVPKKPISAITGGAALYVDVTQDTGYVSITGGLEKMIPNWTVTAELIQETGPPIVITNTASAHNGKEVALILTRENESMPTDTKFKKVRIRSSRPIKRTSVTWRNYTM